MCKKKQVCQFCQRNVQKMTCRFDRKTQNLIRKILKVICILQIAKP